MNLAATTTIRRAAGALGVLAVGLVVLAACGHGGGGTSTLKTGGTLTIAIDAESQGWVPGAATLSYGGSLVSQALYDNIARIENGEPAAFLAQSITPSSDFATWTVKLRSGIKYVDGSAVSAADLKADMDNYLKLPTSSAKSQVADVDHVDVVDDLTAKYVLVGPNAEFNWVLAMIQAFKPDRKQLFGQDYAAHPMGTGPFMLDRWDRNQQAVLKRNPNYWRKDANGKQLPYLDSIVFKPVPNTDSRLAAVEAGDVDSMFGLDPQTLTQAAQQSSLSVSSYVSAGGNGFFFNNMKPPVDDVRVRKGLAYATDRAAVVAAGGGEKKYQVVRSQYFPPGSPYYFKDVEDAFPKQDLAKAKDLLSQYINDPKRSDGKPVGTPLTIEISVRPDASQQAECQVAQSEWGQAGVTVTLVTKQEATLISDAVKGNFTVNWWQFGEQSPYGLFSHNYLPYPQNPSNYAHYNNERVIADTKALATATTLKAAQDKIHDISMIFADQVPVIFLGSGVLGFGNRKSVEALTMRPGYVATSVDWAYVWKKS